MKKKIWQIRIPTSAALILLFISIWVSSYLIQTGVITIGRAAPDKIPGNVVISNITSTSFAVGFTTNSKTISAITVNQAGKNIGTYFDVRDKNNDNQEYYSHRIIAINLTPNTLYQFSIISGGETYNLTEGSLYEAKTGPKVPGSSKFTAKVTGKVILPDSTNAQDTLVEVSIPGAQKITSLTDLSGKFSISLNGLLTSDLKSYINPVLTSKISFKFAKQNLTSIIKSTIDKSISLPVTTLSYQYDFSTTSQVQSTDEASILTVPGQEGQTSFSQVTIANPLNKTSLIDKQPSFSGTALPGKLVRILIDSKSIGTTTSTSRGAWTFRPTTPLPAGDYQLSIQSSDNIGIYKTASIEFTILPSGSQIAESATKSATIIPKPTKTPTPTVSPTRIPTIVPSRTPTPSTAPTVSQLIPTTVLPTTGSQITPSPTLIIPTIQPTNTPAPTLIAIIPTTQTTTVVNPTTPPATITPVETGSFSSISMGIASFILIIGGAALFFIL